MFTDNQDPVNLIAVDMKTGEQVASMPVIDELPEGTQVSVENSATVYDDGAVSYTHLDVYKRQAKKYAYVRDGHADHEIIAMNHSFHGRSIGACLLYTSNF